MSLANISHRTLSCFLFYKIWPYRTILAYYYSPRTWELREWVARYLVVPGTFITVLIGVPLLTRYPLLILPRAQQSIYTYACLDNVARTWVRQTEVFTSL